MSRFSSVLAVSWLVGCASAFLSCRQHQLTSRLQHCLSLSPPITFGLLQRDRQRRLIPLALASPKKGFGSAPEPVTKKRKVGPASPSQEPQQLQQRLKKDPELNAGQKALADMRRQKAEQKDAELRKIMELKQLDQQVQDSAPAIPEKVAMRMGKRMLPFVGVPLFLSMTSFVAFWYFATYKNIEFQPGMVASVSIALLVFGLLVSVVAVSRGLVKCNRKLR